MKKNVKALAKRGFTHGGAPVIETTDSLLLLRRTVMSCFLWEDTFYENGESVAVRIKRLAAEVAPEHVAALAVEARDAGLRHVPLLLLVTLARTASGRKDGLVRTTVERVIRRADELTELLKLYWDENGKDASVSGQLKKGIAAAFGKFDAYRLAKYNRPSEVKLRDAMRIAHPRPNPKNVDALRALNDGTLESPDTWEVALSSGADKKDTFERLLREGKLGYLALLRNLRNMVQSGVDRSLIVHALKEGKGSDMVLPFRYVAAARACPEMTGPLDDAFQDRLSRNFRLPGTTLVVVDVSGSMHATMSGKSDMNRMDAGGALAAVARGICDDAIIYATAGSDMARRHKTALVPTTRGLSLVGEIGRMSGPLGGGGIFLTQCMNFIRERHPGVKFDRVIVITDEQDCSGSADAPSKAPLLGRHNYIINVASYKNGIGHGNWTTVHGFSENVFKYILENERTKALDELFETDAQLL